MPGTVIIGAVAVRVRPDTSKFRRELKRDLDEIEKSTRPIHIDVEIDPEDVVNQVTEAARVADNLASVRIEAEVVVDDKTLAATEASLKDKKVKVKADVDADTTSTEKLIASINEIVAKHTAKIDVDVDQSKFQRFRSEFSNISRTLSDELKQNINAGLSDIRIHTGLKNENLLNEIGGQIDEVQNYVRAHKIKLGMETDPAAAAKLKAHIEEIEAQLRDRNVRLAVLMDESSLELMKRRLSNIPATIKLKDEATAKIREIINRKWEDIRLKTNVDNGSLRRDIEEAMLQVQAQVGEIKARLEIETNPATVAKLKAELAGFEKELKDMDARLNVGLEPFSLAKTWAQLKKLQLPMNKEIILRVNKAAAASVGTALARLTGIRMLWALHQEKFQAMANFDQVALKIGKATAAMALMSSAMASMLANTLSVSQGILQIGAVAYALPGTLAAVGAQFFILKTAFADFSKVLPGFQSSWKELQKSLSDNFWSKAAKPIQDMIDTVFPRFQKEMANSASYTGRWAAGMAAGMKAAFGGNFMARNFDLINTGMLNLTKSTGALTNVLASYISFGLAQFPKLTQKITDLTIRFDAWTTKVQADGSMQRWYDQATANFGALIGTIVNLGKTFWNVMSVAQSAGASTLQSLESVTAKMAEVTSGAFFQERLQQTLSSVMGLVDAIGIAITQNMGDLATALSGTLIMGFNHLAPAIGGLVASIMQGLSTPEFQRGLLAMFDALSVAAKDFTPMMSILASKIGLVGQGAGEVIKQLAPLFAQFIGEAAGFLTAVMPSFITALQTIGPAMQTVFEALAPVWSKMGEVVAQLLTTMAPVIAQLATGLAPILAQIGGVLADVMLQTIQALAPVMPLIAQAILQIVQALAPLAADIGKALVDIIKAIVPLIPVLVPLMVQIVRLIVPLVQQLLPVIVSLIQQLAPIIKDVAQWLSQMIGKLTPLIQTLWPILVQVFKFIAGFVIDTIKHVLNGVQNIVEGVVNVVMGIWNFFDDLFHGRWGELWDDVKQIFSGVWQAIVGFLEVYVYGGFLKGLGSIGTMFKSGFTTIWTAVKSIFEKGVGGAIEFVTALPGKISSFFKGDGLKSFLESGSNVIKGLVQGIKDNAGKVVDFIRGVCSDALDAVKNFFGIHSPSRVMRTMGGYIMEGLYLGIEDQHKSVLDSVKDIAKDIKAVDFSLSSVDTSSLDSIDVPQGSLNVAAQNQAAYTSMMRDLNITVTGSNLDANDVAGEFMFALNRAQHGGVYGSRL